MQYNSQKRRQTAGRVFENGGGCSTAATTTTTRAARKKTRDENLRFSNLKLPLHKRARGTRRAPPRKMRSTIWKDRDEERKNTERTQTLKHSK